MQCFIGVFGRERGRVGTTDPGEFGECFGEQLRSGRLFSGVSAIDSEEEYIGEQRDKHKLERGRSGLAADLCGKQEETIEQEHFAGEGGGGDIGVGGEGASARR